MEFVQQKTDTEHIETSDNMHKGSGVEDISISIKNASIGVLYKKRVFWLVLLVFGNVFSGAGIAYFEEIITSYVALVFFLPLLIDSGGNAGSQSATLMVRALATGDVKPNDWGKMLGREVFVALGLGLSMAAAVYLLGLYRGGYEIAMVVGLSMIAIVLIGSLIGTILPFGLHKLKLDPASASAPMITSIADISGVLIYFAIASAVLEIG
jgi:magnesium transporter